MRESWLKVTHLGSVVSMVSTAVGRGLLEQLAHSWVTGDSRQREAALVGTLCTEVLQRGLGCARLRCAAQRARGGRARVSRLRYDQAVWRVL